MNKKTKIIITIVLGLASALSIVEVFRSVRFKQRDIDYAYIDYDWDDDTGLINVKVEGQRLTIGADKIVSLPTDYEAGNVLYVSEYKTFFFTRTVYEVKMFVILIPTEGHGDDWKLGL